MNIDAFGWRRATITLNGLAIGMEEAGDSPRARKRYHYHRGVTYVAIERRKSFQSWITSTYSDAQTFLLGEEKHYYVLKLPN
ncbi:hypothetical protein M8494_27380 [Serratia ureilytica]